MTVDNLTATDRDLVTLAKHKISVTTTWDIYGERQYTALLRDPPRVPIHVLYTHPTLYGLCEEIKRRLRGRYSIVDGCALCGTKAPETPPSGKYTCHHCGHTQKLEVP